MQVPVTVTDAAVVGAEFETVGLGSDERYLTDDVELVPELTDAIEG
jgi:hypothetical protein